jgi:hypothetical protein
LLAIFTNNNITGTSTKTPTTVAKDAPEFNPNNPIATATANSKKLEELMKEAGAAMLCGIFALYIQKYTKPNIKKLCKIIGVATIKIGAGFSIKISA